MNVIFGSGVVGLLAKLILGSSWTVVPFARSRFFSFNPALDDNFIIRDDEIDPFIKELTGAIGKPQTYVYSRAWSIAGELLSTWDTGLCNDWLYKIFGTKVPPQSEIYFRDRMNLFVYDLRINGIYQSLINKAMPELKEESSKGTISEIGDHYFIRDGIRQDFDHAVSTIPLNALYKLMGNGIELPSKAIHYLHIKTKDLDFEGVNQTLVVDTIFDFFKATNIAPERYLIFCHNDIPDPGVYFMNFIPKFDILDGTSIAEAIPMGQIPKLDGIEKCGIYCVGSYAQWDWCMDVGSCILRLMRYANRGLKPSGLRKVK